LVSFLEISFFLCVHAMRAIKSTFHCSRFDFYYCAKCIKMEVTIATTLMFRAVLLLGTLTQLLEKNKERKLKAANQCF